MRKYAGRRRRSIREQCEEDSIGLQAAHRRRIPPRLFAHRFMVPVGRRRSDAIGAQFGGQEEQPPIALRRPGEEMRLSTPIIGE